MDARERYDEICDDLAARNPEVVLTQMMGMPAVKADGKLVCGCVRSEGAMVFKLPDTSARTPRRSVSTARTSSTRAETAGPFKEWVVVPEAHASEWPRLAEQALSQRTT